MTKDPRGSSSLNNVFVVFNLTDNGIYFSILLGKLSIVIFIYVQATSYDSLFLLFFSRPVFEI